MVTRARRGTTLRWWLENTGDAHWQDGARVVVLRPGSGRLACGGQPRLRKRRAATLVVLLRL